MNHPGDQQTADFVRALEREGGSSVDCRRSLLREGLAHMARPHITLSNDEVDNILWRLCRDAIDLAPANDDQTRRDCFLCVLQREVPLVSQADFDGVRCRFASLEAAIVTAVAHVMGMPDARRLECVAQGRCVWVVDWSVAAADALFEALRVTTLGTVRDAFEHYTRTKSVVSLKGLLAKKDQSRLMVSAAGESEFEVATSVVSLADVATARAPETRFIPPAFGRIVYPEFFGLDHIPLSSLRLLLVGGACGAGKTLAALFFAMDFESRCISFTHSQRYSPVNCVYYCKAEDFTTMALDAADGAAPPPFCYGNHRHPTSLHSSTRRLAEYVIVTLMGCSPPPPKVVRSYECRLVIVIDDVGCFPSLVSDLIRHYDSLIVVLKEVLQVESVQIIAAGRGLERFGEEHYCRGPVLMMNILITTNIWERSIVRELEKEVPYVRLARSIVGDDPHNLGWLRSALTNARFATIFSDLVRRSTEDLDAQSLTMFMPDWIACRGMSTFAMMALHRCAELSGMTRSTDAIHALQSAIGAMMDRQPMSTVDCEISRHVRFGTALPAANDCDSPSTRVVWPPYIVDRMHCSMYMFFANAIEPRVDSYKLPQAVIDFAFLAASLPPADLEGRPRVPPLRRILNGLGNDVAASSGTCAWRAPSPLAFDEDTDWSDVRTHHIWVELRTCVRAGRAAIVSNRTGYATSLFVVAPRVVTLLHTVACPHDPLTAEQVREALLRMAPAGAWDGSTRDSFDDPSEEDVLQQRVPEELVALVRGVRLRRCPQTQRAVVRRPPAGDTAPPACVVNVAVVFEGAYAAGLRDHVLCGAYGAQWSDLAASGRSCSGPFAVREASPHGDGGGAPDGGRSRAEVVLDYVVVDQTVERGGADVLRVAYRFFIVDVTWRRRVPRWEKSARSPVSSDSCWLSPGEALPPLYPAARRSCMTKWFKVPK